MNLSGSTRASSDDIWINIVFLNDIGNLNHRIRRSIQVGPSGAWLMMFEYTISASYWHLDVFHLIRHFTSSLCYTDVSETPSLKMAAKVKMKVASVLDMNADQQYSIERFSEFLQYSRTVSLSSILHSSLLLYLCPLGATSLLISLPVTEIDQGLRGFNWFQILYLDTPFWL